MSMSRKILLENANAQGILIWLNENFQKENGKKFNRNDVTFYILRKKLPAYLGDIQIEVAPRKNCTIKMYNVLSSDPNVINVE